MLTFDFQDKKFLIAGIGGIGYSIANLLGQLNAELFVIDIDTEKMEYAKNNISSIKQCVCCDFSNVENIEDTINNLLIKSGTLDGFVFCSGITASRPFKMLKYKDIINVMNINFFSFVEIVRCITKKGCYNSGMSIVGISSVGAYLGNSSQTAYCASKAAMNGAVRSIAIELAPKGIRVNTVAPGTTDTPMFKNAKDDIGVDSEVFQRRLDRQYLGICQAEDIANAVVFLLSSMSRMISGSCLAVDGGKLTS